MKNFESLGKEKVSVIHSAFGDKPHVVAFVEVDKTLSDEDKLTVSRARKMQKFMSQPFFVAEQFTGVEGRYVSLEDTISSFEAIVNGEMDEYAENTFSYVGSINEVVDKAKKKWKHLN